MSHIKTTVELELQPIRLPEQIYAKALCAGEQPIRVAFCDLAPHAIAGLCDRFRQAMFETAGKREPPTYLPSQDLSITPEMVSRFLSWKLPGDFAPDAGIVFTPPSHWPTGTNLLNADQARAMLEYVVLGPCIREGQENG